jgi:hypothetical protein
VSAPVAEPRSDPFGVLGLAPTASLADVRAARKRLALELHPDRGGDGERMREVNVAFEAAVAHLTGRRPLPVAGDHAGAPASPAATGRRLRPAPRHGRAGVQHDVPSFVIEALPVQAFEALVVVTSWLGEVLVDDPPYLLDVLLYDPIECWCRLELVPDAGSSTVSLTVAPVGDGAAPDVELVRDVWVDQLNQLGRWDPS